MVVGRPVLFVDDVHLEERVKAWADAQHDLVSLLLAALNSDLS